MFSLTRIGKDINALAGLNDKKRYLCIQVVRKALKKLALNWVLLSKQSQVMAEFVMCCNNDSFSKFVKLRPSSSTKYLHDI